MVAGKNSTLGGEADTLMSSEPQLIQTEELLRMTRLRRQKKVESQ